MEKFKKDVLKEYVQTSELRIFSDKIRVRLNRALANKYDEDLYDDYLKYIEKCYILISTLNFTFPSNANLIYYIYMAPDDQYVELLDYPSKFDKGTGGGSPVTCYDLDGYVYAFGISQNKCENFKVDEKDISFFETELHEISHIIHGNFFTKCSILKEGV